MCIRDSVTDTWVRLSPQTVLHTNERTLHRKFIDRVAQREATSASDFVWNMADAKNLHGDITKLMLDLRLLQSNPTEEIPQTIEVDGGNW